MNLSVPAFALWTLFVWGGRLRNLWREPGGLAEAGRWSLYGSVVFTILGLAVLGAWVAKRRAMPRSVGSGRAVVGAVSALAALTVGVWLVRAVDIALGDHGFGFILVHVVLAVISVALAVAAIVSGAGSGAGRVTSIRWVSQ